MKFKGDVEKKDELQIIQAVKKDKSAYRDIVELYYDKLHRYLRYIGIKDKDEAEDVLQEVFIKAYININSYNTNLKFSSWLYRIAHNEAVNKWRKEKNHIRLENEEVRESLINNLIEEKYIDQSLDSAYQERLVKQALQTLDSKYKDVLILYYLEEKSYEEIADVLKKPVGTIGTLLSRGKNQLRIRIDEPSFKTAFAYSLNAKLV